MSKKILGHQLTLETVLNMEQKFCHHQTALTQTSHKHGSMQLPVWSGCDDRVEAITIKNSSSGQVLLEIVSSLQYLVSLSATWDSVPRTPALLLLLPLLKSRSLAARTAQTLSVQGNYCARCTAHLHTNQQEKNERHTATGPNRCHKQLLHKCIWKGN